MFGQTIVSPCITQTLPHSLWTLLSLSAGISCVTHTQTHLWVWREVNTHINTHRCKCLSDIRLTSDRRTVSSLLYERKQHSLCAIRPVARPCAITLHLNVSRQPRNIYVTLFYLSSCDGMLGDVLHYHTHTKWDCIHIITLLVSVTNTCSEEHS